MFQLWSRSRSLRGGGVTLVIDPDPTFRHFAMRALRGLGRNVVGQRDGEGALAWLDANHAPALITLDTTLPRMDGFRLCAKIRQHRRASAVPIVCASSSTDLDAHIHALQVGADAFLAKPIRPDLFLEAVMRLLRAGSHNSDAMGGWINERGM